MSEKQSEKNVMCSRGDHPESPGSGHHVPKTAGVVRLRKWLEPKSHHGQVAVCIVMMSVIFIRYRIFLDKKSEIAFIRHSFIGIGGAATILEPRIYVETCV